MPNSSPDPMDDKSLSRLMLELLWQILVLVGPIFLVTILPPWLALLAVVILAGLMWIASKLGAERTAKAFSSVLSGAVFGLGFSLGRALPLYWNIAAAFFSIIAGMAFVSSLERRLGMAKPEPLASPSGGSAGGSAWGGNEPTVTPEGEPIRVFNHGEIAMGGPTYCDYLFSDGVLLQGVGSSARFSSDGRYFAAPVPSRQSWSLLILDRQQRRVYHCDTEQFWELDEFSEQGLSGRYSPLVDNGAQRASLADLLKNARTVDLVKVVDIWLEADQSERLQEPASYPAPKGNVQVEGLPMLPASLKDLPQPTDPLRYPRYRLSVNGEPSAMLIYSNAPLIWNPDGSAFACHAQRDDQKNDGYWLWSRDSGWQLLPEPWAASDNEPSLTCQEPLELNDQYLWIKARFDYPQPDRGQFGYQLHSIHSDTSNQVGHDRSGRMEIAGVKMTRMRLAIPLNGAKTGEAGHVESLPLLDRQRARLTWQQYNRAGLGGYLCAIGDWQLPGLWLLDHRVSDCTRYLALVPFAQAPAVSGQVVVVDTREKRLLHSPPLLVARLLDFSDSRLSLAAIYGRLDRSKNTTALHRYDQIAPDASNAAQFCRYQQDSQLYYKTVHLHVKAGSLQQLDDWRMVNRPQSAIADADFIQPSPGDKDAAWLFGSETEYADSWLRQDCARLGGHLLTASGCALRDLAPSMVWSPAGRYLALTRYLPDLNDEYSGRRCEWQLLFLDVQDRSLRYFPDWLGDCAEFVAFDRDKIRVRIFGDDWDPFVVDSSTVKSIALSDVLAQPAEALEEHQGIWLPAALKNEATQWQALDKTPLTRWMSKP